MSLDNKPPLLLPEALEPAAASSGGAGGSPPAGMGGVKRNAAFGTNNTLSRALVLIVAVAVMPGRKVKSSLLTDNNVT